MVVPAFSSANLKIREIFKKTTRSLIILNQELKKYLC